MRKPTSLSLINLFSACFSPSSFFRTTRSYDTLGTLSPNVPPASWSNSAWFSRWRFSSVSVRTARSCEDGLIESERHLNVSGLYSPAATRRSRSSMVEVRASISVAREALVVVRAEREVISGGRGNVKRSVGCQL